MNKKNWFKCYSWNLKQFIQAHGIYPYSSGVNPKTDKVYHLFAVNDELSRVLTNWRKHKDDKR